MGRKRRVDYHGAFHHIMCRGNNGSFIFKKDNQKIKYLALIQKYKKEYNVKLLAYCLMDNHVHILVQSGEEHISKMMHSVQTMYSRWYHKQNKSYGSIYSGRYINSCCSSLSYFYHLLRYIHLNPLKAGLTSSYSYKFSSYDEYIKGQVMMNILKVKVCVIYPFRIH